MTANQYPPPAYFETAWRLAAGVAPVSALGGTAPLPGVRLAREQVPKPFPVPAGAGAIGDYHVGIGLPAVPRNDIGRFAITYPVLGLTPGVAVRLYDIERRYVPRRFLLPVPAEATVISEEQAAESPPWPSIPSRVFRPVLYPGANYGTQAGATVVRGRVLRKDGSAARWARVSALSAEDATHPPVGWAHGDDRGEFLLILQPSDAQLAAPGSAIARVTLTITARPVPATVDSPAESQADPLWDLEIEALPPPGSTDRVSDGQTPPADYTETLTTTLSFVKGAVSHPSRPFVLP
jgi:hypothetical protein